MCAQGTAAFSEEGVLFPRLTFKSLRRSVTGASASVRLSVTAKMQWNVSSTLVRLNGKTFL
jgi:hypothetical protein